MALTKQEYLDKLAEIGTCEDDVTRRSLLTAMTEEATNLFDTNSSLVTENDKLKKDIDSVRDANMQLFLRVSGKEKEHIDHSGNEPDKKKLEFKDLFNEKGGLK